VTVYGDELLPGLESVMPEGAAIVAVFVIDVVAALWIVAITVYVIVLPDGILTVSEILPVLPVLEPEPVAPPLVVLDQLSDEISDGIVSVTVAAVTSEGPLFVTTTV